MKPSDGVRLFSYLKNTDLACLSAKEAIRQLLAYQPLLQLKKYTLWDIALTGEGAQQTVERIVTGQPPQLPLYLFGAAPEPARP